MFGARREARAMEVAWSTFAKGASQPVLIAKKAPFPCAFSSVATLEDASAFGEDAFDSVLWRVDRPLREGVFLLRRVLKPGAKVFFIVDLVPKPLERLRELLGRRTVLRFSREEVCEALVLAGLEAPQVWIDGPKLVALSGNVPSAFEALDQVFSQPLSA